MMHNFQGQKDHSEEREKSLLKCEMWYSELNKSQIIQQPFPTFIGCVT
jgi:hypothetical protein